MGFFFIKRSCIYEGIQLSTFGSRVYIGSILVVKQAFQTCNKLFETIQLGRRFIVHDIENTSKRILLADWGQTLKYQQWLTYEDIANNFAIDNVTIDFFR